MKSGDALTITCTYSGYPTQQSESCGRSAIGSCSWSEMFACTVHSELCARAVNCSANHASQFTRASVSPRAPDNLSYWPGHSIPAQGAPEIRRIIPLHVSRTSMRFFGLAWCWQRDRREYRSLQRSRLRMCGVWRVRWVQAAYGPLSTMRRAHLRWLYWRASLSTRTAQMGSCLTRSEAGQRFPLIVLSLSAAPQWTTPKFLLWLQSAVPPD